MPRYDRQHVQRQRISKDKVIHVHEPGVLQHPRAQGGIARYVSLQHPGLGLERMSNAAQSLIARLPEPGNQLAQEALRRLGARDNMLGRSNHQLHTLVSTFLMTRARGGARSTAGADGSSLVLSHP